MKIYTACVLWFPMYERTKKKSQVSGLALQGITEKQKQKGNQDYEETPKAAAATAAEFPNVCCRRISFKIASWIFFDSQQCW